MKSLHPLIKVALLGTEYEPLPNISQDTPLGQLLNQALEPDTTPEQRFLHLVGAITLHEQSGQLPRHYPPGDQSYPRLDNEPPRCSLPASRRLAAILDGRLQDLLPEFLLALDQTEQRVPEEYLPNLLNRGAKLATLRPLLLPVIGQGGRWLARQNPAWTFAAPESDNWSGIMAQWHNSNATQQQNLLRQLRQIRPEIGRQLLETIWKGETQAVRGSLIKIMSLGLSMADEPFLEMALDDRNNIVRRKAAELLTYLPESRLCQRMSHITGRILLWTPRREYQILVNFPAAITPTLVRDGVLLRTSGNVARIRGAQLTEMVRAVPLTFWNDRWQASAEEIIQAVQTSRWPRTLTKAFTTAAERQQNAEWARALLDQDDYGLSTVRLVKMLSIAEIETVLQQAYDPHQLLKDSKFFTILRRWPHPWNETLARLWFKFISDHLAHDLENHSPETSFRTPLKQFARLCPPELAEEMADGFLPLAERKDGWRLLFQDFVTILRFRKAMLEELVAGTQ